MSESTNGQVLDGYTPTSSSEPKGTREALPRHVVQNKVTRPYGGATVEERRAAMGARLTEDEIAARNVLPDGVTNPHNGDPFRCNFPFFIVEHI